METDHKNLIKSIRKAYTTGRSLFIAGTTGIGKSYCVKQVAEKIAKEENRTFVEWNRISDKEKLALEENKAKRESSFVFVDLRISQLDPSDLRGLPKLNGKDYVEWKPTLLFRVLSLDGVKGVLFFDEMNLAPPSVQATAYQIVLDKCVGEIALNPDVCILGAGNRLEDKANVFEMSAPLRNRFRHITLAVPTYEKWVDWAIDKGVDDRIITFVNFKPVSLMAEISKTKDLSAFATPRSWEFASDLINGETNLDDIKQYVSECVGDGTSIEFVSFLKLKEKIDLNSILDKPEQVENLDLDLKWSVISAVSEKYRSDKKILDKALKVCDHLPIDFGASLLRLMKRQNQSHFVSTVIKCGNFKQISDKYGKFIRSEA